MKGRRTSKHYRVAVIQVQREAGPEWKRVKVPTRAGQRRLRRRLALLEVFDTAFRNGDSPRAAVQAASRMLGARLADRRWLLRTIARTGVQG